MPSKNKREYQLYRKKKKMAITKIIKLFVLIFLFLNNIWELFIC